MNEYVWTYGDIEIQYQVTRWENGENVKIIDSYLIKSDAVKLAFLDELKDDELLDNRSYKSLIREWKAHNILYKFGLFKERTRDTDLDNQESIFRRIGYFIITLLFKE